MPSWEVSTRLPKERRGSKVPPNGSTRKAPLFQIMSILPYKSNYSVHKQSPPPISIFTRIYFSTSLLPEVSPSAPFMQAVATVGNITESDPKSQLYSAFKPLPDYDVVLQKTRYFAGADNTLVQILQNQKIDTVILVRLP